MSPPSPPSPPYPSYFYSDLNPNALPFNLHHRRNSHFTSSAPSSFHHHPPPPPQYPFSVHHNQPPVLSYPHPQPYNYYFTTPPPQHYSPNAFFDGGPSEVYLNPTIPHPRASSNYRTVIGEIHGRRKAALKKKVRFPRCAPPRRRNMGKAAAVVEETTITLDAAYYNNNNSGGGEITSLMIRNIPNNFRRGHLIQYLDKHCHDQNTKAVASFAASSVGGSRCLLSEYDFLYLPMDFRTGANLGYAFVNFTNSVGASRFRESFDNYRWNVPAGNNKICKITSATIQGKEALLDNFNNSKFKCDRKYYLPVVFSPARNGVNRSDPNPIGLYFPTPRPPKHVHHGKRRPTN